MASQAALGQSALKNKDYPAAIRHYTDALKQSQSPLWLIARSTAYQRTSPAQHALALIDAENAVIQAKARGKRELIAQAQFRRAVSLHRGGRIGDARLALIWARKLDEKNRDFSFYQTRVVSDFDKLAKDDPGRIVTISETPEERKAPEVVKSVETAKTVAIPDLKTQDSTSSLPPKIRHEWFQSSAKVTITLFAKGVPKEKADIEFTDNSLSVEFPTALSSVNFNFTLLPLFSKIDPSQSSYNVTPNKVEISLHKASPGVKWSTLEGAEMPEEPVKSAVASEVISTPDEAPKTKSSASKNAKNWDKIVDIEDEDDDGSKGGADDFFQKLYAGADPDTKRAMMKSFVESNGTTLSTDWTDVGSKTVETRPPEGIEAKKWTT